MHIIILVAFFFIPFNYFIALYISILPDKNLVTCELTVMDYNPSVKKISSHEPHIFVSKFDMLH